MRLAGRLVLLVLAAASLALACEEQQTYRPRDTGSRAKDDASIERDAAISMDDAGASTDGASIDGAGSSDGGADLTDGAVEDAGAGAADSGLEPEWYRRAIGYEVFVRSFQDSDGDGIGDLRGLLSRLDHLNDGDPSTTEDLGVDVLWLMPIFDSSSWHGYDVRDYLRVRAEYGTMADAQALFAAARTRGVRVVLDFVMNHTSLEHPWFVESSSDRSAARRDWYVWRDMDPGWMKPWGPGQTWFDLNGAWYYGVFSRRLPDLNFAHPDVLPELEDAARFWLERGADGFRLDAARYLVETGAGAGQSDRPETHAIWRRFRTFVDGVRPNALLVGEIWADGSAIVPYFGTREEPELQMAFDFPAQGGILSALREGRAGPAAQYLSERLSTYPAWGEAGTFLGNHDQARLATELAGANAPPEALRLAAVILLSWPGTPWLYYGEEIGMANGSGVAGDPTKRRPMQWEEGGNAGFTTGTPWVPPASTALADTIAGQTADPRSLLSLYRRLIRIRRDTPALSSGRTQIAAATGSSSEPLVIVRESGASKVVGIYNFGRSANMVRIPARDLPGAVRFASLWTTDVVTRASTSDDLVITIEPLGWRLLAAE